MSGSCLHQEGVESLLAGVLLLLVKGEGGSSKGESGDGDTSSSGEGDAALGGLWLGVDFKGLHGGATSA